VGRGRPRAVLLLPGGEDAVRVREAAARHEHGLCLGVGLHEHAERTAADTTYQDVRGTVTEPDGAPTETAEIGADSENPWVELTWPEPIRADRVVLYDRTSHDNAHGGTLAFGDGSTVDVTAIPPNGDPKTVTFGSRSFDRLRFQVAGGSGPNVGLLELEVYAQPQDRGRR
jgi:hypothetical protein